MLRTIFQGKRKPVYGKCAKDRKRSELSGCTLFSKDLTKLRLYFPPPKKVFFFVFEKKQQKMRNRCG